MTIDMQKLVSDQLVEEALGELAQRLPVKAKRVNLAEFFPKGKIETREDFHMMRGAFHQLSEDHPSKKDILLMLRNTPIPEDGLSQELFMMNPANFYLENPGQDNENLILLGRKRFEREYK